MKIIACDESFSDQMLAIFNDAIVTSTAMYDYKPRTIDSMKNWFESKRQGNFPVVGIVSEQGELMGFASYGIFRNWPAYKYTVEHSVYVAKSQRGQGIGKQLLRLIIDEAKKQDYHVLVGVIDSDNAASIALHQSLGFEHAGTLRHVGFKFGRWLDVAIYQLVLETPREAVEG